MNEEEIVGELSKITALSPGFCNQLSDLLAGEIYQPHQVIAAPGNKNQRIWLVHNGIIRAYFFDDRGRDLTEAFYSSGALIFFWEGYYSQRNDLYLEVLQQSMVYSITYDDLPALENYPEFGRLARHYLLAQRRRELMKNRLLLWNATERYNYFRTHSPEIFRSVSLRIIASYLNMTRENLSRLVARKR